MNQRLGGVLCLFVLAGCGGARGTGDGTNLALGRPVSISGVGETNLVAVMTDGRLAPEGARADDAAVGVDGVRSALIVDLGLAQEVGAFLLQADSHDVYFVETSTDQSQWDVRWRVAPLPGMGPLRTRTTVLPARVTARWLRVRPATGRSPSVSELQAFRDAPASWPLEPETGPQPLWPELAGNRLATLSAAVTSLFLLAAGWSVLARRAAFAPSDERRRRALLVAVASASLAAWLNFGNFHFPSFVHTWEMFHYYIGGKYLPELGYTRLYACAAVADADDGIDLRGHVMRDLRTNQVVPAEHELARADECHSTFSPRRWDAFMRDARFFREAMGQGWFAVRNDHGFNATPVWAVAGGLLADMGTASWGQIEALAALDLVLIAAIFTILGRAFGLEAACLGAAWFGTNSLAPFVWTGGGLLRYDWLLALVAGVAALRAERHALAGALLGYATLLRLFPAVAIAGVVLKAGAESVEQRSLRPLVGLARFAGGAALAFVVLGLASTLLAGRVTVWTDFAENIAKHAASVSSNRIGLRVFLSYDTDTRLQLATDPLLADRHETWRAGLQQREAKARPIQLVALAAAALLVARAARGRHAWLAAVLGLTLMPVAFELSGYYYAGFTVLAALSALHPATALALAALACVSNVVMGLWTFPDEQHAVLSLVVVLFSAALPAALAWWPRHPPKQEA
jgi:hypothetical protein